jgi:CheY-like chemotaxis protein
MRDEVEPHGGREMLPHVHDTGPDLARRRVLVVDDNPDITETLGEMMGLLGHDVRIAHDGVAALAIADEFHPDFVLLDIGMPGMSGYQVAGALRAQPGGEHLTLVAITGWGQDTDVCRPREVGFDRHLVKPVGVDELRAALRIVRR